MDLQGKIVLAHKGFFDKESEKKYRENSKELCAIAASKDYISIIEVDVRKSKDGVLYCYHGSTFQYWFSSRFSDTFAKLRQKYKVDTLAEILEVIPENKSILLDIKDLSITKEDILACMGSRKFKEVIIGNPSVSFLKRFDGMPKEFVKIFFGNVFSNFYDLENLQKQNFKYFDVVFPFQINKSIVERTKSLGMRFGCFPLFFWSKEAYWDKVNKYGIERIPSDFI